MIFSTYLLESAKTAADLKENNLVHYIFGMVGEYFGEVFTPVIMDGSKDDLIKEYGDFLWYFAGYCRERKIVINDLVTKPNKFKLSVSEALGMLVEHEKKVLLGVKQFDVDHASFLCTNIYYSVAVTMMEVGSSIEYCMQKNIEKLAVRYPKGTFDLQDGKDKVDQNEG